MALNHPMPNYDSWLARPYEYPDDGRECPDCGREVEVDVRECEAWCEHCGWSDGKDWDVEAERRGGV